MIVAGGLYREVCERPEWNATFGSGGRAAAALVGVTPQVDLYTYCHPKRSTDLDGIGDRGVTVHGIPSVNEIAFAYLHPLSHPGVAFGRPDIVSEEPINCHGNVILRFGMLEGDAVVHGDRVIYDPQTSGRVACFTENGSTARSLAVVLNARELQGSTPNVTMQSAAELIMLSNDADLAVVKCGVNGAAVVEKGNDLSWVPAFRTPEVFKIGSGDVFSATFAHYWGVERRPAIDAAILASRSTSAYCASRELPIPIESALPQFPPIDRKDRTEICIVGAKDTLANHWLLAEACWCLKQFGCRVRILNTELTDIRFLPKGTNSTLVLADTFEDHGSISIETMAEFNMPSVILGERRNPTVASGSRMAVTDDFATAIYWAAWQ